MIHPYSKKTEVLNTKDAVGYLLAKTDNNDIVELHINQNGVVPAHKLPIDVTFYVISGNGLITIAKEEIKASQGDVVDVKGGLERSWKNSSKETLKLLVIKQNHHADV